MTVMVQSSNQKEVENNISCVYLSVANVLVFVYGYWKERGR